MSASDRHRKKSARRGGVKSAAKKFERAARTHGVAAAIGMIGTAAIPVSRYRETKPTNPKDKFGVQKASMSYVPSSVLMEVALGMHEGGLKYGRHNYRVMGVRGSVYYDATMRHLMAWWEGEDYDPNSGADLHHISKAIASLVVLRDAMLFDKFVDDRPPALKPGWVERMSLKVIELSQHFPNPVPPFTEKPLPPR